MKTVVYIAIGVVIGAILFILGAMDDAPGLCLMGCVIAFLLGMRGLWHAKLIRKGLYIPIVLLVFGMVGILFSNVLFFDNEIGLRAAVIGNMVSTVVTMIAVWKIRGKA